MLPRECEDAKKHFGAQSLALTHVPGAAGHDDVEVEGHHRRQGQHRGLLVDDPGEVRGAPEQAGSPPGPARGTWPGSFPASAWVRVRGSPPGSTPHRPRTCFKSSQHTDSRPVRQGRVEWPFGGIHADSISGTNLGLSCNSHDLHESAGPCWSAGLSVCKLTLPGHVCPLSLCLSFGISRREFGKRRILSSNCAASGRCRLFAAVSPPA